MDATRALALAVGTTDVGRGEMAAATEALEAWVARLGAGDRLASVPAPTYRESVGALSYHAAVNNPALPPVPMSFINGEAWSSLLLDELYEGPRDSAHGGVLSCLMDTFLASLVQHHGHLCVTASLTTDYRARTPLYRSLDLGARIVEVTDRTVRAIGTVSAGGRVTAEATALFVTVNDR